MNKVCFHCKLYFLDKTKNLNRIHCGSVECKKNQDKVYRTQRDKDKYRLNQIKFKEKNPNYLKDWRAENKEHDRELNRNYIKKRYHSDINYKLRMRLRNRLYSALNCNQKIGSAVNDLGCSVEELKKHLEFKFQLGMIWDNYGEWEIDHIRPLINFNLQNREDFLLACNYNNLQPLWRLCNRQKGAKYVI